jgi:hypothetical protein
MPMEMWTATKGNKNENKLGWKYEQSAELDSIERENMKYRNPITHANLRFRTTCSLSANKINRIFFDWVCSHGLFSPTPSIVPCLQIRWVGWPLLFKYYVPEERQKEVKWRKKVIS